jgi:hypothetical protein
MNPDHEILAAALRWHTVYIKRLTIGAENARRQKAERADYRDGHRRYFGSSSGETGPLLMAIKRTELAALRNLAKVCAKVRTNQNDVVDIDMIDVAMPLALTCD